MMSVASGGPATQANEAIARVFITSAAPAPECLSSAHRSVLPTTGLPRTTRTERDGLRRPVRVPLDGRKRGPGAVFG